MMILLFIVTFIFLMLFGFPSNKQKKIKTKHRKRRDNYIPKATTTKVKKKICKR